MLKEDLNGKLLQRAEIVGQREDLEALAEHAKTLNGFEIDLLESRNRLHDEITLISEKMGSLDQQYTSILARKDKIDTDMAILNESILKQDMLQDTALKEIAERETLMSLELQRLNLKMTKDSNKICIEEFESILKEAANCYLEEIKKKILEKQNLLITNEEILLKQDFESKLKDITSQIENAQESIKQPSRDEIASNNIQDLNQELKVLKSNYITRLNAIDKWRKLSFENTDPEIGGITENLNTESILWKLKNLLTEKGLAQNEQELNIVYFQDYISILQFHQSYCN